MTDWQIQAILDDDPIHKLEHEVAVRDKAIELLAVLAAGTTGAESVIESAMKAARLAVPFKHWGED